MAAPAPPAPPCTLANLENRRFGDAWPIECAGVTLTLDQEVANFNNADLTGSHFNSTKQLQAMELRALEDDARERREEEEATARERREEEERLAAEATRRREEEEARLEELARAATMPTAGSAQRRVASFERRLSAGTVGAALPPLRRGRSECRKTVHIMSSEV